jgi:hypothetical protein
MLCSYQFLWEVPLISIVHSFGGVALKSLVVEAHKHENQISKNAMDEVMQKNCNKFLSNLKGVVFYGVPHVGGIENLPQYLISYQLQHNNGSPWPHLWLFYRISFS